MVDGVKGRRPRSGWRPSARLVQFLALLDQGMTAAQASAVVGVNPRTGLDWAKGIRKSAGSRYTFDGQLVWARRDRPVVPVSQ